MVEPDRSSAAEPPESGLSDPAASHLASLLDLLADTEEQLLQTRQALRYAEQKADRATAESAAFRAEIEGTAAELVAAEARVGELHKQWLDAAASAQAFRQELDDVRSSRSWRITAPVRAVTGVRRTPPPGGPAA